jgi:hypothetical protein
MKFKSAVYIIKCLLNAFLFLWGAYLFLTSLIYGDSLGTAELTTVAGLVFMGFARYFLNSDREEHLAETEEKV